MCSDADLIKVKDSAPTVICTLAIKIAKHREEAEFCKTRNTGKILISSSSTLGARSASDRTLNLKCVQCVLSFVFLNYIFFCDSGDRWFIKTDFAFSRTPQHPGWRAQH